MQVAGAAALLAGRDHALPDDIGGMRHAVLRHGLGLTFEAVAERVSVESLIDAVFKAVPTP